MEAILKFYFTDRRAPTPASKMIDALGMRRRAAFDRPIVASGSIGNADRAFGADIAVAIAARFGDAGLSDRALVLAMTGSAGQSFGAFAVPGMHLALLGDANDGLGKGMHGGEIIVSAPAAERKRAAQVRVGNAALYGATGGRVFIAGRAGERFAVRNSGASAVVEGVGDHACEYMTGGIVVVLGPVGRNFGSGMTGGVAYVFDPASALVRRTHPERLRLAPLTTADRMAVRRLLAAHELATGSQAVAAILRCDPDLTSFACVRPRSPEDADRHAAASADAPSAGPPSADPAPHALSA